MNRNSWFCCLILLIIIYLLSQIIINKISNTFAIKQPKLNNITVNYNFKNNIEIVDLIFIQYYNPLEKEYIKIINNNHSVLNYFTSNLINSHKSYKNFKIINFLNNNNNNNKSPILKYNIENNNNNNNKIFKDISFSNNKNIFDKLISNHLILEITSLNDLIDLFDFIEFIEGKIKNSITIFGFCFLRENLEENIDNFLSSHRVWSIKFNYSFNCKLNNYEKSFEYGQLIQLIKVSESFDTFKFYNYLDKLQFYNNNNGGNKNNYNNKILIHSLRPFGMISSLHFLGYSLTLSLEWNRTLIIDDSKFLFSNKFTDLFLPITAKTKFENFNNVEEKSAQIINFLKSEKEYNHSNPISIITNDYHVYVDFKSCNEFPKQWFQGGDLYCFKSHIMNYIIRPNYKIRKIIELHKLNLFHNDKNNYNINNDELNCLAIHIRNGDKVIENSMKNKSIVLNYFQDYLDFIVNDKYLNNGRNFIKNIFVMSDNQTIFNIDLPNAQIRYPQFKFHYLKDIIRDDNTTNFIKYLNDDNYDTNLKTLKNRPNSNIGNGLLSEIIIASECQYFIGSQTSNVARLIVELMNANRKSNPSLKIKLYKTLDNSSWFADP
ncbi:hypothetical protein DDB_G0280571 [Dictyostelium discoideum AX4]|uniref:GT23 domain-containing protein n=1 Tax=Dictyostelium discoideum TaxID=44689 RepID=Q54V75_DICDI|nr:hypothetical protein DDB_G0280571 [Dictyostelium discoideum AX4]EAL67087.1 hypothetical protein DDB_G0280571 [Dictyostelium discoideum AX4]|eukprot:XP_641056.1 hypothetical protein DDB_G0280571 [Dictyostelium discoideum AX4]